MEVVNEILAGLLKFTQINCNSTLMRFDFLIIVIINVVVLLYIYTCTYVYVYVCIYVYTCKFVLSKIK